ncbi:beta-lactamase domain protein [Thermosinus carboxydivorans Nor1]|uniref:Beta-lactamase domain protein n=1 Tax=Thermosinus carboxydivorans Nor1 TaxID=401526 RepID=A1HST6_9FIRM|nr:MBL fold metallo-hydrolase [Thermosinus carboxydivorans]EAX46880.1 beta-lactamase domain protein [Thermosinus carboxydivorans Nor1]
MGKIWRWRRLLAVCLAILLVIAAGCGGQGKTAVEPQKASGQSTAGTVTVKVLDVGQGDAILIRTGGQTVLIDTGDVPAREQLVKYIKNEGITVIDKLIITHPHADHLGGAAAIFNNFTVRQVYDSGQTTTSGLYRQYLETVQKKNIPFSVLTAGQMVDIGGGALLKALAPEKPYIQGTESDLNNNSIVVKLVYGNFSMLLTGDAEKEAEERMLKSGSAELKSTILKSAHHGSSSSSTPAFLAAVAPEAVIISVGANNDYHHPHPSTLKKYNERKLKIYRTDKDGTVTVTTDGKGYTISKEKG